jgi:peptidyl-prolyl cis-trans isomerase D
MGQNMIETIKLNSIRDNNKFEINSVQILYSIPINSFTLINDEKNNIYLAKIKKIENQSINDDQKILNEYTNKHNSNSKNEMLKSYDLYLNNKYKVTLNQKTIDRVKNFFQ